MPLQKSSGVVIANAALPYYSVWFFLIIQYGDCHPDQLLMFFQMSVSCGLSMAIITVRKSVSAGAVSSRNMPWFSSRTVP